jgi:hypothetical protein
MIYIEVIDIPFLAGMRRSTIRRMPTNRAVPSPRQSARRTRRTRRTRMAQSPSQRRPRNLKMTSDPKRLIFNMIVFGDGQVYNVEPV